MYPDSDPNGDPPEFYPEDGCLVCGILFGLALALLLALGIYKATKLYVSYMPNRAFIHEVR